jgi:succinate dehydrogenase/fumarate reductase cytochrome b subunit
VQEATTTFTTVSTFAAFTALRMSQPSGLARLPRMTDQRLRAAQALTGTTFAAFLFVHLINQMLATRGAATYDSVQGTLRAGYQTPLVEVGLVLTPLVLHAGLAVRAMSRRRGTGAAAPTGLARLHRWSGRVLLLFFLGHVGATRLPALLAGAAPGFAGVAFTFKWVPWWFWPYYPTLALAGWFHLLFGLGTSLPQLGFNPAGRLLERRVLVSAFVLGALALLAGVWTFGQADESVMGSTYARWYLDSPHPDPLP